MGIVDSKTGREKIFSAEEIKKAAQEMRAYVITALHAAASGHPGGSLSAQDIIACLFLNKLRHDPKNPAWRDRDRFFLSKAHIVPALYSALVYTGYYKLEEMMSLRRLGSTFQGHSDMLKCPALELSGGSLGQGLGAAVGSALAAKLNKQEHKVFCMMGDGEQQEGSIWEAIMSASNFKLDNLIAIVDRNLLQIDGKTEEIMALDPLTERYESFGWKVIEVDGHDINQILDALDLAMKTKNMPTLVLAHTVKGKGVSFMENAVEWHGQAPNKEQFEQAIKELQVKLDYDHLLKTAEEFAKKVSLQVKKETPKFSKDYWWNASEKMHVKMEPTRTGFGKALQEIGDDERIVTLHADTAESIKISLFEKDHPERTARSFSLGIAEQNMMTIAAGLAKEGKIPVAGTYGVFASGRPWDQLRTTICYGNLNVKIGGSHAGITVGADGATHQSLEEISLIHILPNMHLFVPCDTIEANKLMKKMTLEINGPCYIRFGREATAIVTKEKTPCKIGGANIIRYRAEKKDFIDAFEIITAEKYKNENEDIAIIACGAMLPEAMRAAYILKEEFKIEARVINEYSLKPLNKEAILNAAKEIGLILTVEEHQVGGFGNIIAGAIVKEKAFNEPLKFEMIGIQDCFGESGNPWNLLKHFGLTAEHIAKKAKELIEKNKG